MVDEEDVPVVVRTLFRTAGDKDSTLVNFVLPLPALSPFVCVCVLLF